MEEDNYSYPKIGDKLFKEIKTDRYNVCLDPFSEDWAKYTCGYKDAADILVDYFCNNQYSKYLVFPILFLYRHYIELQLKMIIKDGYQLLDIKKDFRKCHIIEELWRDCRTIIEKTWPNGASDPLDATEACIFELSLIDPASIEFRYPIRKNGTLTIPDLMYVNLKNFFEVMKKIDNLLSSICDAICIDLEQKKDIEGQYSFDQD